jgi:hypothetical protein
MQLAFDLTKNLLNEPDVARVDSCATADHPMINHIWHEQLTLSDRLIALRPAHCRSRCLSEQVCRSAFAAAKSVRSRVRR